MINNEVKFSHTSSSKKCISVTTTSDGNKTVKESSEHEVRTQVCEEESSVLVEHGGSISER